MKLPSMSTVHESISGKQARRLVRQALHSFGAPRPKWVEIWLVEPNSCWHVDDFSAEVVLFWQTKTHIGRVKLKLYRGWEEAKVTEYSPRGEFINY